MTQDISVPFVKMHGAGNDFVFIDQRDLPATTQLTTDVIAAICHRQLGVGADGLIVIGSGSEESTDFKMTYYNADGGEAEMCGNGARCSVAFAYERGLCGEKCTFNTYVGVLEGVVNGPQDITVSLTGWTDLDLDIDLPESPWTGLHTCNTGVPHLVIAVDDTEDIDIKKWGATFRHHQRFAPAGTNVNWVAHDPSSREYRLRTYERGVENETLACGTGASAAAVVLCHLNEAESPVAVRTRGGDLLQITVEKESGRLLLRGPAVVSFHGTVGLAG